jgi:hypothetical protein
VANPPTPKKSQIRAALVALLERVRSGNGYWTEMGLNVSTDRKPVQEHRAGEMPRAVVTWMGEKPIEGGCLGGMGRVSCPFVIYVVVGGPRGQIQDLIDRTEQDVKRAVFSDMTLNGTAVLVSYVGSDTDQQLLVSMDAGSQVRAQVAVTFEAQYDMTAAAP